MAFKAFTSLHKPSVLIKNLFNIVYFSLNLQNPDDDT